MRLLLIILFLTTLSYSQNIKPADIKIKDGQAFFAGKTVFQDFALNDVSVNFTFATSAERYKSTSISEINAMLKKAVEQSTLQAKNKFTFVPKFVGMTFSDSDKFWKISITYTAQNDYGATKDGTCTTRFTLDGIAYDTICN